MFCAAELGGEPILMLPLYGVTQNGERGVADWTSGYITEIGYHHAYHAELKPLLMRQALLSRGMRPRWGEPLRYLELGFGQGVSLNIHAAAMQGEFWGCDFNPAQAMYALEAASASGANVRILDDSFEELAQRSDLPTFDIIALHGIWSWISEANRRLIVEIARRHLAIDGVFYMSYNTNPGWSAFMPLRHLLGLHAEYLSGPAQSISSRLVAAVDFAQLLADGNAAYFRANPRAAERLPRIKTMNPNYAVHEYLTADSHPMAFSDVAGILAEAKLSFATTTFLVDHVDALHLTEDQQKLMQGLSHPVLRESVRDFMINQQFRRDLWVRDPRSISPLEHAEIARAQSYALVTVPGKISFRTPGSAGEIQLQESRYRPLIEALAQRAYAPKTLAQLCAALPGFTFQQVSQSVLVLSGLGHVVPTQGPEAAALSQPACARLNAHTLKLATHSGEVGHLASPIIGGGISANRFEQLFIRSIGQGKKTPAEWTQDAWSLLSVQGDRLLKEGKLLESADDSLAELGKLAAAFEERLPILRAMEVL